MGRLAIAPGMPGGKMKEAAAMAQRIYIIEDDVALRTELAHDFLQGRASIKFSRELLKVG